MIKLLPVLLLFFYLGPFALAQSNPEVEIPPPVSDRQIDERLESLLAVTEWYPEVDLDVKHGLVILKGSVADEKKREWLTQLCEKTEGVVGVIDRLGVRAEEANVLDPAFNEIKELSQSSIKQIPYIISALIVMLIALILAFFARSAVKRFMLGNTNGLMSQAVSNVVLVLCLCLGLYLSLNLSGLSGLAFTVLGGTGIVGIAIGLALKGTFENYVAGIMISVRQVFKQGEMISLLGHTGVVQAVTTRSTSIMDFEGNNVIIPNSEVFAATIKNLTRNPNMRLDFNVGIGYDDSIDEARAIIIKALAELEGVVQKEPESFVAVDSLGAATVNLKVYFWFDAANLSIIKVKSAVIEKVKVALMKGGISMPDDAREVVFANPLVVHQESSVPKGFAPTQVIPALKDKVTDSSLQDLATERGTLQLQAEKTGTVEVGSNLLKK